MNIAPRVCDVEEEERKLREVRDVGKAENLSFLY